MDDVQSGDKLLKALDDLKVENQKRLAILKEKIIFLEEYLQGEAIFQKVKIPSVEKEVAISVDGILTDIDDLFLIRRDREFLSSCLKILQNKFNVLNSGNVQLLKSKRIQEIKISLERAINDLENKLKFIEGKIKKDANFWEKIDIAERAFLYLPEYGYIKNLLKEIDVLDLEKDLVKGEVQRFHSLIKQYKNIIQPVEELKFSWIDETT